MAAAIALRADFDRVALQTLVKSTGKTRRLHSLVEAFDAGSHFGATRVGVA